MHHESTKKQTRHVGQNVRKVRTYFGIKQGSLASDLGISQSEVSKIERQDEVEPGLLSRIAHILGVSIEMIKNFDADRVICNINTTGDHSLKEDTTLFVQPFNPLDKIVELYERLLKSEKEKIELLNSR